MGRESGLDRDCRHTLRDVLMGADAADSLAPVVQLVPALAEDYQQAA
jgi:hypothetical protein